MQYRVLGKTGLRAGVIGLGTWQFGGEWGKSFQQPEVTAILRRAAELGVNLIDTAECYGDHLSEKLIGAALQELNLRERFILATKFGHHFTGPFQREEPRTARDVEKQLADSLFALRTDYIDLYQYHSWADDQFLSDEVRGVLEKAKTAGKIRHIGNSLGNAPKTLRQIENAPAFNVEAVQVVYNRLSQSAEDTIFPLCRRLELGAIARVPLASGLLSGKYKPGDRFEESDVRSRWDPDQANLRIAEAQQVLANEVPPGIPPARWALAWCLKNPAVSCVIPGCKSVAQLDENALAADLSL